MGKTEIIAEPGIPQVVITREFDAPRDLVFRAYTERELLERWLGPVGHTVKYEVYEPRDGGRYRYVHTDDEGRQYAFRGVFHGTPAPDQTVQTFEFEGMPGHVAMETLTLREEDGRTLVTTVSSFQSVEDRDGMVASGMEHGVRASDERLTELLATLAG